MTAPTLATLGGPDREGSQWTAREIAHQPETWREVAAFVESSRQAIDEFLVPLLKRGDLRAILTGAGTSAFVGEVLAPGLSRRMGRPVDAVATTDIVSNPREVFAEDRPTLLVSFARSGASPESFAATALADQVLSDCYHLVITCDSSGTLYRRRASTNRSLALLMPEGTNDRGFAMTSSFTSMLLAGWLVLGQAPAERTVEPLAAAGEELLASRVGAAGQLAAAAYERIVYLGSGALKGLARESALKMLELTAGSVVTAFDSPMGFRHGPKAILNDRTLVVVYVSNDPYTRQYDLDVVVELRRTVAPRSVITVSASLDAGPPAPQNWHLNGLEAFPDSLLALPFVLVAQLLGLYFSIAHGKTPDNPFPSGEVNRVVKGVTIHPLTDRPTRSSPPAEASTSEVNRGSA